MLSQRATIEDVSKPVTHRVLALAVFALVLAMDIVTKAWAEAVLTEPVRVAAGFYLMLRHNSGLFLGTVPLPAAYWLCVLAATGWMGWRALRSRNAVLAVCLAAVLAGLAGNAIGQAQGAVVDFIGVGPVRGNEWLVVNVADLAQVGGVLVLGVYLLWRRGHGVYPPAIEAKPDKKRPGAES